MPASMLGPKLSPLCLTEDRRCPYLLAALFCKNELPELDAFRQRGVKTPGRLRGIEAGKRPHGRRLPSPGMALFPVN